MAVAFDAVSNNGEATAATSSTWSHTVGASLSNGILVVSIATRDGSNSDQLATGVTYGGVALTRAGFAQYTSGPPIRTELWYLKNPTAGAANIVASFTGTVDHMSCGAVSFSGVDQTIPFVNNIGTQAATGVGDISLAVQTIVANAWTIDAAYSKTSSDMTIDGSRTSRWQLSPNTNGDRAASGTYDGVVTPADTTHTWATNPDDDLAYIIGVLRPSGVYSSGIDLISESSGRGSGSSRTFSHTIPSGFSNTILIVGVSTQDSNHANMPITGITFNGVALTKVRHDEATGNNRTELWYLKNPDVTTANVVITATGTLGELTGFALGFCNVDQTSPIDANNGGTGASSSPSVSLTTVAANAWTVAICSAEERFRHYGTQANRAGGPLTDQTYENAMIATKFVPTAGSTALGFGILSSNSYAESTLSLTPASGATTRTTTFTIDGIVKETKTTTFTIDGIVKEINTTTFTLDGIVLKATDASFTIDGIVLKTTDAPFTIDGIVLYTTTTTFTIDGLILTQPTTTFTIDGIVLRATDASFTIDGIVLRATDTTFTIDGLVKEINTTTFTIDGIVLRATDTSFTIDGIVLFTDTETFTIDAIVLRAYDTSFTIDGLVLEVNTKTFTIDGIVLRTYETSFTIDGIVFSTNDKTFTIDAVVLMADQKTFTIDGIVLYADTETFTIDGLVKEINSTSFTIDGIVLNITTTEFTIDGIIFSTNTIEFTIDGLVNTSAGTTFTIDGLVLRATDATFTIDGIVKEVNIALFTIDAIVLRATDINFTIDGIVFSTDTETFTIDAVILNADQKTFTLDGIVLRGSTIEFTVDGVVKEVHSTLFTIDGLTKEINTTQFSIDGIVKTIDSSSFTIDGVVKTIQTIEFTIDGEVVLAESSTTSFTIDAEVVIPTYSSPGGKTIRGLYEPQKDNSKGLADRRNGVYGEDEKYRPLVSPWSDKLNI